MAWYVSALKRETSKYGYGSTTAHTKGVVRVIIHSAEGYRAGMFAVLDGPRKSSWHFSVMKNGEVYQHVSTGNISWASGNFEANNGSINIEEEGKAGEALTPAQYASTIALLLWLFRGYGFGLPSRETNLREHNEFWNTSCPSGRIPWKKIILALMEADMDEVTVRRLIHEAMSGHENEIHPKLIETLTSALSRISALEARDTTQGGLQRGDTVRLE